MLKGYLICSIERTGSSLLAQALHSTGIAGEPYEYFNPVLQQSSWFLQILNGRTLRDGLPAVVRRACTPNGMFGSKMHWLHAKHLTVSLTGGTPLPTDTSRYGQLLAGELPEWLWDDSDFAKSYLHLRALVPDLRVLWLRRSNSVARAISFYRALHTGRWHRDPGDTQLDYTFDTLEFDYAQIDKLRLLGARQNASWARVFDELGIVPYNVWYEDLANHYEPTVRGVLDYLGLEHDHIVPPELLRQADFTSHEWEIRYRVATRKLKEGA